MNITEDIVESIGFVKKENSSNPVYYFLKVNTEDLKGTVIIGKDVESDEVVWSLRRNGGDCAPFVQKIETICDLVSVISQHSFKLGDRSRRIKLKKAIGIR